MANAMAAVAANATAMMMCVVIRPNHLTNLGVKNADSAVPTMPAPNTPVAKPRRAGSYQLFENGMPTAKIVPATPRKNPNTINNGYDPIVPAIPTANTGTIDDRVTAMSMTRPPKRSVSGPLTSRPNDPTRMGVATSSEAWVLLSESRSAYVVDMGPIKFHAQKLIVETHVANARFTPCPTYVDDGAAVVTNPGKHRGADAGRAFSENLSVDWNAGVRTAPPLVAEEARLYQQAKVDPAEPTRPYRVVRRIEETADVITLVLEPTGANGAPDGRVAPPQEKEWRLRIAVAKIGDQYRGSRVAFLPPAGAGAA